MIVPPHPSRSGDFANRLRGFTLVELMVALAVLAILLAIGVPSFRQLIETNRAASQVNELIGALHTARSEAVRRNAVHRFCTNDTDWIIRTPTSNAAIRQGRLQANTSVSQTCIDFRPDGLPYSCTCGNNAVGANLVTAGQITVTAGAQNRHIRVRTGSIHVE